MIAQAEQPAPAACPPFPGNRVKSGAASTLRAPGDDLVRMSITVDEDVRVGALRGAVAELLAGYSEVARLLADVDPSLRDAVLSPLRRAADSAASVLGSI